MAYRPEVPAVRAGGHGTAVVTEHSGGIIAALEQALAASK